MAKKSTEQTSVKKTQPTKKKSSAKVVTKSVAKHEANEKSSREQENRKRRTGFSVVEGVVTLTVGEKLGARPLNTVMIAKRMLSEGTREGEEVKEVILNASARNMELIEKLWGILGFRSDLKTKLTHTNDDYGRIRTQISIKKGVL